MIKKGNSKQVTRTTTTIMLALAAVLTMNVLNNNSLSTIIPAFADGKDHHDGKDRDGKDHDGIDRDGKGHKGKGPDQIPTVVTIPLEGLSLNNIEASGQFLLLSDTTPVRVAAAHLAINVPCTENEQTGEVTSDIIAVAGVAPDELEIIELDDSNFVQALSAPPNNCLFHIDIPNNGFEVTDIAIANTGADIEFGSGHFATLSITEVDKFEYGHMQYPGNP
jgi:hypothetical protein